MEKNLSDILKRYEEIETLIIQPDVVSNPAKYSALMKERGKLIRFATPLQALRDIRKQVSELTVLLGEQGHEADFYQLMKEELEVLAKKEQELVSRIEEMILANEENANRNVIMEIRAGTGGEEAALFASELFRMYSKYIDKKHWKMTLIDTSSTGLGGFKDASFSIEGEDVYKHLRFESGGHRVQRVPQTEASGRIHTSACTVAVLPEAEEVELEIRTEDLKVDTYSAGGPGGQHVNKTASAVRLTHIPTGTVVACQTERSQHRNRDLAMRLLRTRIYDAMASKVKKERDTIRKTQIGSGDRSEKIRTYNFPQSRVTDHRINFSVYNLPEFMDGNIDEMVDKLIEVDKQERLSAVKGTKDTLNTKN
ncbi:MAG: peptide chain release factor 1 [Candidatus Brocadiia bacterium]